MEFDHQYKQCATLQTKIKQEYVLFTTEQEQKNKFYKKLNISLKNYYRNLVHFGEIFNREANGKKVLLENPGFGNCFPLIKEVILSLVQNPDISLLIIDQLNSQEKVEKFFGVVRAMINNMYENVVDDELTHKDMLYFINGIIKIVVGSKQDIQKYNFNEYGLAAEALREFTRRSEHISYASQVIKNTLLEIKKLERLIDFNEVDSDIDGLAKEISKTDNKRFDSPIKMPEPKQDQIVYSKSESYSNALRKQDLKLKTSPTPNLKNKFCVSTDLIRLLGINENANLPSFSYANRNEEELKEEDKINLQWAMVLNKKDNGESKASMKDVIELKNLVFLFFSDLFRMLYSMPRAIRIVCRLLFNELIKKYNKRKTCLSVVGNFVVGNLILTAFEEKENIMESTKAFETASQNAIMVKKIVYGILHNDFKNIDEAFQPEFSSILSNLRNSLFVYLSELINIEVPEFKKSEEHSQIKSYSVCLSVSDVHKVLDMIKMSGEEINRIDNEILKKVEKIYEMSDGHDLFGSKNDKDTNREYKSTHAFVLFSSLALPKLLSFDYPKYYNDAFKKEKVKNIFRQVLLNISDMEEIYEFPVNCNNLNDFFASLIKTKQENLNLNSVDHVSVELKIKYLLSVSAKSNLEDLLETMLKEVQDRLTFLNDVWDKSKEIYLKALSSIKRQSEKISFDEINNKQEEKKKKLEQFMKTSKINACLTSPTTREKEIAFKTSMMKEVTGEEKERIWLENQSSCIHSTLNEEFVKSLTGEGEKNKYESHITHPIKFSDIFCELPEVKQNGMTGKDLIGMKDALSNFITFCVELMKRDNEYRELADDVEWLEKNLEQKISKKIYDNLYPRMPTYDDLGLYFRLKTLSWVSYEHLRIDPSMRVDKIWERAAKHLKQLDRMKTASEKLKCIVYCFQMLVKSYALMGSIEKPVTGEDIFPIVIFVLIKAAPRRLISNINFIDVFTSQNRLMSEDGYCFSQLKSAIHFCQYLKHDDVGIGMIEYNRMIFQKEIEYGIYFLLIRRKEEPKMGMKKIEYLKSYCEEKENVKDEINIEVTERERKNVGFEEKTQN